MSTSRAFPYARFAESLGLRGIRVEHPDKIGGDWDEALAADRPVVLEAITDPDVPTLPPHISLEQARKFTETLLKGDPREGGIIKQAVKGMVESFIHHSE